MAALASLVSGCASSPSLSLTGQASAPAAGFTAILGPTAGAGSRTFVITAPRALSFALTCLGHRLVWFRTTPNVVGIGVQCDNGGITGGDWLNVPATSIGRRIEVHIVAPGTTSWLVRIDGSKVTHSTDG